MSRPPKLRPDLNETAFRIVQAATGQGEKPLSPDERTEKHPDAVERGRKGGKKGGAARSAMLSGKRKKAIARKAATARWSKKRP